MKHANTRIPGLIALAIPFLAMAFMIGSNLFSLSHTEYRLAIQGHDPRDLLRGHYLIFQYIWPENAGNQCKENSTDCCACFNGDTNAPDIAFKECSATDQLQQCRGVLKVAHTWNNSYQPDGNLRRYYIPEAKAKTLETLLRDHPELFEIGLVVQPMKNGTNKNGKVKMLYINTKTLPQFLSDMSAAPDAAAQ